VVAAQFDGIARLGARGVQVIGDALAQALQVVGEAGVVEGVAPRGRGSDGLGLVAQRVDALQLLKDQGKAGVFVCGGRQRHGRADGEVRDEQGEGEDVAHDDAPMLVRASLASIWGMSVEKLKSIGSVYWRSSGCSGVPEHAAPAVCGGSPHRNDLMTSAG